MSHGSVEHRPRGRSKERRSSDDEDSLTAALVPPEKRSLLRRVFSKSPRTSPAPPLSRDASTTKKDAGNKHFAGNWNVAFDKKGNLFLSDYRDNHARMIKAQDLTTLFPDVDTLNQIQTKNLNAVIRAGLARGGKNMTVENLIVSHPSGIALNPRGGMIIADTFNHRICEVSPKGVMITLAGNNESREGREDGREGWRASFSLPRGMDTDKEGNIYIADWGSHLVRKITTQGGESAITTTLAGNPKLKGHKDGTEARFYRPSDVAVDGEGNVLVADQRNNCIRKISPAGVTSTLAGQEMAGSTDGRRASFDSPTGVAVSPDGRVLVADQNNNQLRVISPLGFTFSVTDGNIFDRPCGLAVDPKGNVVLVDHLDCLYLVPAGLIKELEQKFDAEITSAEEKSSEEPSSLLISQSLCADEDRSKKSFSGTRCRICHELTDNNGPMCEYHTLLSGGLTMSTELKGDDDESNSSTTRRAGFVPVMTRMDRTKDLLAAMSRHSTSRQSGSYSSSGTGSGRNSVSGSYFERLDYRAMLVADPTLERLLAVPVALHFFARFLISECSEENIEFWESVNKWTVDCDLGNLSNEALLDEAKTIISTFIGEEAPRQVNLTSAVVAQVRAAEKLEDISLKILELRDALAVSKAAVMKLLGDDGFRRFLKSPLWQEFLSATQEIRTGPTQTVHLPNGDLYVGETKEGKFHGHGTCTFHNGDKYTGKYKDGLMHGVGEFVSKKERFVGEFAEDLKHGEGALYQLDSDNFIDSVWVKDKLHGQGTINEGTTIYDAIWVEGAVICKVERTTERLLGNYVAENIVGSRRVYCSLGINGVMYGYSKGRSSQQETGTLSWIDLDTVSIDTVASQVMLRFVKHGQPRSLVIHPCEPIATTTKIIERVGFLENITQANMGLLLVQAKVLFARIEEKIKRREEYSTRFAEVQNSLTEVDMTLTELQTEFSEVRAHTLSVDRSQLPDIRKEQQKLSGECLQLESYLDPKLLLADYKFVKELQAHLLEQKAIPLDRPASAKLTFSQKLTVGHARKHSPSPRRGSPKAADDVQRAEEISNQILALFQAHQIPTA